MKKPNAVLSVGAPISLGFYGCSYLIEPPSENHVAMALRCSHVRTLLFDLGSDATRGTAHGSGRTVPAAFGR